MQIRENIEQVRNDSRSPALWLLLLLVLSVCFFTLGFVVGRWTTKTYPPTAPASSTPNPASNVNNR